MEYLLSTPWLYYTFAAALGLAIGSFMNVVIVRLPAMLLHDWRRQARELLGLAVEETPPPPGLVVEASHCPQCKTPIKAYDNIPLVSYGLLRGRCRACRAPIGRRYPVYEFLTMAVTLAVVAVVPWGYALAGALLLSWALIALTGIDLDHQMLPDPITLPLLWLGLLLNTGSLYTDLHSAVFGAAAGYIVLWAVFHLFRLLTGKEGMGYGDFKLLAALGAWLGWTMLPLVILLSSLSGALVGLALLLTGRMHRDKPLPFGPYLAFAGWIALLYGEQIVAWYLGASRLA